MAFVKLTEVDTNKVEIEFTVERDKFDAAVDAQFKKNLSKMSVPGFRKGKAPRKMIEKLYGNGVFYNEALDDVIPDAYADALKASGAEVVARPDISLDEIGEEGDITLKATVFVKPVVTIDGYKGLEAVKVVHPVTDEDVDADIERLRQRNSRTVDVEDRAAALDDTVDINYKGESEGNFFEGGTADNYKLKLGSHSFIDTFEDQIVGHNIGDEFDVNVTFPETYGEASLAGKPAIFHCKLNGITVTELPELDDEFAKDVSEFDTLEALKEDSRKKLQERNDNMSDSRVENELASKLAELVTNEIPAPMVDEEVETLLREQDYNMRAQGLSLDMYMKYTGATLDSMREQMKPNGEKNVKVRLALEAIAKAENVETTDEDYEAEVETYVKMYNMTAEEVKERLTRDLVDNDLKLRKAMKLVKENAVLTEKTEEELEAEAKAAAETEAAVEEAKKDEE